MIWTVMFFTIPFLIFTYGAITEKLEQKKRGLGYFRKRNPLKTFKRSLSLAAPVVLFLFSILTWSFNFLVLLNVSFLAAIAAYKRKKLITKRIQERKERNSQYF